MQRHGSEGLAPERGRADDVAGACADGVRELLRSHRRRLLLAAAEHCSHAQSRISTGHITAQPIGRTEQRGALLSGTTAAVTALPPPWLNPKSAASVNMSANRLPSATTRKQQKYTTNTSCPSAARAKLGSRPRRSDMPPRRIEPRALAPLLTDITKPLRCTSSEVSQRQRGE